MKGRGDSTYLRALHGIGKRLNAVRKEGVLCCVFQGSRVAHFGSCRIAFAKNIFYDNQGNLAWLRSAELSRYKNSSVVILSSQLKQEKEVLY